MKQLLILLVLISTAVQAEIYKSQNEKGEWSYSDKPTPSAKAMKLPPLSTYTPTVTKLQPVPVESDESLNTYNSMVFLEPENHFTLRDLDGVINASVKLEPLLKSQRGHKIQYYLDDVAHGAPMVSSKLTLEKLERGAHTLGASVVDAEGAPIVTATPVTFYVHRISLNSPARIKPLPLPKPKPKPN